MEYRRKQAAIAMRGKEVRSLTKGHKTKVRKGKKKGFKQGESLYLRFVWLRFANSASLAQKSNHVPLQSRAAATAQANAQGSNG